MTLYPYLGTNVDPSHISEIHYRGLLEEGETLLALFDGVLVDERGRRIGGVSLTDFVVLSDQRLITWARGFFNDSVDGFPWKDVDVVESKTWDPLHGRVVLAFRLIPVTPRQRRIAIKGMKANESSGDQAERIIVNTLDYMPAGDIPVLTDMVGWIGDQVVAGVSGDELLAAFADTFPLPDADPVVPPEMLDATSAPSPNFQSKDDAQKRSWWSFGNKDGKQEEDLVDSPDKLIAAYEVQRGGEAASPMAQQSSLFPTRNPGAVPTAFGQFGFYDVSRGMRLLFEGPRRMGTSLNRVNDVLVDTAELIEDLQDPKMRKRTISGLRFAMDMQDQSSGLLGAVAPVVRAVLGSGGQEGGGSRRDSSEDSSDRPSVRRIQVRASVRQREKQRAATQEEDVAAGATEETPAPTQRSAESPRPSVRRDSESAAPAASSNTRVRRQIRPRKSSTEEKSDSAPESTTEQAAAAPESISVKSNRSSSSADEAAQPSEEKE
jgi:hypothetical protein